MFTVPARGLVVRASFVVGRSGFDSRPR